MTSLLEGARKLVTRGSDIGERVSGLGAATEAARGRIDDALLDDAAAVVERAASRLRLSADHTVVALAGATGSGKSSTFNRLSGLDLSSVGVRRPTTSWATACTWGVNGASELLEWLGIPPRHQVIRDSMLDTGHEAKDLQGLVLLDLPDHDSTEVSHHLEVDRLVLLADLLVWVLDPQKYADAVIHDRYFRPMAAHQGVMMVVVNHIDEVAPERRDSMLADVHRLLVADGLSQVPVLATSARTGEGIDELRSQMAKRVSDKAAARLRLTTDLTRSATAIAAVSGNHRAPKLGDRNKVELKAALADAAGVPIVVAAVYKATSLRTRRATGWPITSWLSRLRPDPLKRLHLDLDASDRSLVARARTSVPDANQVQRARLESAVRSLSDQLSDGLARPWSAALRKASTSRLEDITDRLDRAVGSTDLGVGRTPIWCQLVRLVQWVLLIAALGGAAWLGTLAVMGFLKIDEPSTPELAGVPAPTLILVGGVLLGVLLALACRWFIAIGARARAGRAERRLLGAVGDVAEELVIAPLQAEIDAYTRTVEGLRRARG